MASRTVGGIQWFATTAGAIGACAGMLVVTLLLHESLWPALLAGTGTYLAVLFFVERIVSPFDVEFVTHMLRRRLGMIH
jgi:hypothetical protein